MAAASTRSERAEPAATSVTVDRIAIKGHARITGLAVGEACTGPIEASVLGAGSPASGPTSAKEARRTTRLSRLVFCRRR